VVGEGVVVLGGGLGVEGIESRDEGVALGSEAVDRDGPPEGVGELVSEVCKGGRAGRTLAIGCVVARGGVDTLSYQGGAGDVKAEQLEMKGLSELDQGLCILLERGGVE